MALNAEKGIGRRLVVALAKKSVPPEKTKMFSMRMTEEEFSAIRKAAEALDMAMSEYLIELHNAYVKGLPAK